MKPFRILAAAFPMLVAASAAMAATASYSGNWPAAISGSKSFNGAHCIVLIDDGNVGRPHSGTAELDGTYGGEFEVIGRNIVVYIDYVTEYADMNLVFSANAGNGTIGNGDVASLYGGQFWDSGKAAFGANGGC